MTLTEIEDDQVVPKDAVKKTKMSADWRSGMDNHYHYCCLNQVVVVVVEERMTRQLVVVSYRQLLPSVVTTTDCCCWLHHLKLFPNKKRLVLLFIFS